MTLMRMPLTIWGIFTATVLALLAFPALFVGAVMMTFDKRPGHQLLHARPSLEFGESTGNTMAAALSCSSTCSGSSVTPRSTIVALPAFGIVSDLLSVACEKKHVFGYRMMVWAIVAIGGLSFVVWAHHMYVSGMNPWFGFFFATTTLIIAVPTALKVYNWTLTLWKGNIQSDGSDAVRAWPSSSHS